MQHNRLKRNDSAPELRAAILYQPKINLPRDRVSNPEARRRWQKIQKCVRLPDKKITTFYDVVQEMAYQEALNRIEHIFDKQKNIEGLLEKDIPFWVMKYHSDRAMRLLFSLQENLRPDSNIQNTCLIELYKTVKSIYENSDPLDTYTRLTDQYHYKDVFELVGEVAKKLYGEKASFEVKVAALFHDMERYLPNFKTPSLKSDFDGKIRKKITHPLNSAFLFEYFAGKLPLKPEEMKMIFDLIRYHDAGPKGVEVRKHVLLEPVYSKTRLFKEINILSTADSLAFFRRTMPYFVEDRLRIKKDPAAKILERIDMLYQRLSPEARALAKKECEQSLEKGNLKNNKPEVYAIISEGLKGMD